MIEVWRAMTRLLFDRLGDRADNNFRSIENWAPEELVLEDVGAADAVVVIPHGLRRLPRGLVIMNQVVLSGTDPVGWYRLVTDDAWTEREVSVRFTVANAAVRLWIY